ncbi:MAG: 5-formyltetrahydrofolate cyclo-ligase [Gammaproteobacteria bacterium]|nr:5-formyltetrahydrofolate cyclo-ligase [Gammaproteobacteria bacterium]MBU1656255.1 5-formyltetrahydrofolate cyclo-ligase [Gammaproteobacteria bacterium]MBU1959820.1 5-formyltetrahydrofolate cyclo-ligase [Gammaproteobacteria bacterium]
MPPISPSLSLRKHLREARRALAPRTRLSNEIRIAESLARLPIIQRSRWVALYQSDDGEVDLTLFQRHLLKSGKRPCLPVLRPGRVNRLWFAPFAPDKPLHLNRFGIPEPDTRRQPPLRLRAIDVILMPLVGFDASLNRLGMGGGFYDRTLASHAWSRWRRPRLIGIAHECQRVHALETRPWDIPMDFVVTELGVTSAKKVRQG